MKPELPAPWMLGATKVGDTPMLIVHMSKGELEGLDNLQGGPSVDESTGIREYSALAPIIEKPEVQQLFQKIYGEIKQNGGKPPPNISSAYKEAKKYSLPYRETEEEEHNPLRQLEKLGRNGDSRLAELPKNFVEFIIELGHEASFNPKSGLLEFGFWDEVFKVGGTLLGAVLGGPVGAGVGRALAGAATGQKLGHAAMAGLKTGAGAYGVQGLGQAAGLSAATPMTGGFFGGAPNILGSALGGLGGMGKGAQAASNAYSPLEQNVMNQMGGQAAPTAQAQPGFFSHILGGIGNNIGPLALAGMGGLSYMGAKKQHKHQQEERDRQEAKWDKEREQIRYNTTWTPIMSKPHEPNPEFWNRSEDDIKHGRINAPYYREVGTSGKYADGGLVQSYSKGTLVKGKGKGQDDFIKTSVPEGSYIIDASTTSMLGDGSSEAGGKVLKDFELSVKKKIPKNAMRSVEKLIKRQSNQAPVWLSNDEYKFDPLTVAVLGRGSNEKGSNILRSMVKNIRRHKSEKGDGLPPKAKPLLAYMSSR